MNLLTHCLENTYLLTKLLEIGRLKLKVAVRNSGIYHEKIGYFEDKDENKVAWQDSQTIVELLMSGQF